MVSNKNITANFVQNHYDLDINVVGNGTVNITPNKTNYTYGAVVNLTAISDEGWYFNNWAGDITGNDNPFFAAIVNDIRITAIFKKSLINISTYNITINIEGNGIVNISPNKDNYTYGEIVEITAIPDSNWYFDYWTGDISGNNLSCEINMTCNKNVTAHFKQLENQNNLEKIVGGGRGTSFKPYIVEKSNIPPVAIAGGPYYGKVGEYITFNGSNSYDIDHYPNAWKVCENHFVLHGLIPYYASELMDYYAEAMEKVFNNADKALEHYNKTADYVPLVARQARIKNRR